MNVNAAVGQDPTALHVYLPSGYSISDQNYFTLLSATAFVPNSVFDLADLASQVRIFAADGTEYVGFVELGVTSTNAVPTALTLRWSNMAVVNNTASTMSCNLASTTLTCTGGSTTELNSGINARRLFQDITSLQDGVHTGNLTVTINNVTDTTINSDGTGHSVRIDGAREGSRVTGSLTVNHQTTGTKRDVQVRHRGQAGLYVKGRNAVTVTNGANVLFATNAGRHESSLYGIHAIATGTGNLTVTNNSSATLGFSATCTVSCGQAHRGIAASHIGTGNISIVNSGDINVNATIGVIRMVGILAELSHPSSVASATISNSGSISSRNIAIAVEGGSGKSANVTFASGSDVSATYIYWGEDLGGNSTVTIAGGADVQGGVRSGSGNDAVSVAANGTWRWDSLISDFGSGTDSVTNRGTVHFGMRTRPAGNLIIRGLESFTAESGSIVRFYLGRDFNALKLSSAVRFNGTGSNAPVIEIHLPASYDLSDRTAFDLIDTGSGSLTIANLADLDARVRVLRGAVTYRGRFVLREDGENLQVSWTGLFASVAASTLDCSYSAPTLTCTGGSASELSGGLTMDRMFADVSELAAEGLRSGNLTVTLHSFTSAVNTSGTGHGITLDGTVAGSQVTGSLTVNHQTTGTRRDVSVRGANKAALYVKSAAGVTITNGGNLVFAGTPSHSNGLRGIEAISAGTGSMSITNSATIGFATNCTTNCGTSHWGIFVNHAGSGTVSITNSGTINLTGSGTASHGIQVSAGTATEAITISNTGTINVSGAAVSLTGGEAADTATINFTSGTVTANEIINSDFAGNITTTISGGSAMGRIMLGGGNDTVTVSGGTMTLTNGTSAFGGGTDSLTVNSGGTLIMGNSTNGSDGVTISGLENFNLNANSRLRLYMDSNFNALTIAGTVTLAGSAATAPIIELHLPSGYVVADKNAFAIIDSTTLTLSGITLAHLQERVVIQKGIVTYEGTITLTEVNEELRIAWSDLIARLYCTRTSNTIDCMGGTDSDFASGLTLATIFGKVNVTGSSLAGNLILNLNNLGAHVNATGTGHGITLDGTVTGSRVTGNITLNHQTTTATNAKKEVQVRGANQAALYVKSAVGVTITNGGNLVFAGTPYNNGLRGIEAISAGTAVSASQILPPSALRQTAPPIVARVIGVFCQSCWLWHGEHHQFWNN